MDIITNNPYRVIGVLSNATRKDIERNKSQIKAFAMVDRVPSFPYDFENILGTIGRTEDTLNDAANKLAFDKDKLLYGLFWFNNVSSVDKETISTLKDSDVECAISYVVLHGKPTYSTYINMAILCLMTSNWTAAAYCYVQLFNSIEIWNQYVLSVTDNPQTVSLDDILDIFVEKLTEHFPSVDWLFTFRSKSFKISTRTIDCGEKLIESKIYSILAPKCINSILHEIDSLLEEAKAISRTDIDKNLNMANKLEQTCKNLLLTLKSSVSEGDQTYAHYADKVALQILNNCVFYWNNDSDNPCRPKNVLRYVRFCVKLAESQSVIDRCKKNFDIIKEAYDNMCPQDIVSEVKRIEKVLKEKFCRADIDVNENLKCSISNCHNQLDSIYRKVGANDRFYYSLSERAVRFFLNVLIENINDALKKYDTAPQGNDFYQLYELRLLLRKCQPLFAELASYPMKDPSVILYFSQNDGTFKKLCADYINVGNQQETVHFSDISQHSSNRYGARRDNASSQKDSKEGKRFTKVESLLIWLAALMFVALCFVLFSFSHKESAKKPIESVNTIAGTHTYIYPEEDSVAGPAEQEQETPIDSYDITYYDTGDRPYLNYYGKGRYDSKTKNSLKIVNGSETDAVVFLESFSGKKVRHVYIKKSEHFTMTRIPGGKYIMKVFQGNAWNDDKYNGAGCPLGGFMQDVAISKSDTNDPFNYPYPKSGHYYEYEVSLRKAITGNFHTENISTEDMFN